MTEQQNVANETSTSPAAGLAAWSAMLLAVAGMVLICMGDPFWLGLPCSGLGMLAGRYAIAKGQQRHAAAHLGFHFGVFNLFLWLLMIVLVQYVLKMDPASLFDLPSYQ